MSKKKFRNRQFTQAPQSGQLIPAAPRLLPVMQDPSTLVEVPESFQALSDFFGKSRQANPFAIRLETFRRIERITSTPLISYVTRTHNVDQAMSPYIEDSDLVGFGDLINAVPDDSVDVFLVSNGGSAEASERIVRILRERFTRVRYIIPANAFSAATLMCFSGDEILMDAQGTLGPIDPQINGVPARAIMRAFETIEKRLKEEGPQALGAYLPLIQKYDLHILEICKSSQELSVELARTWLSKYMLKCEETDPKVGTVIDFFSSYDIHKSHGRSIDRNKARELGLSITYVETTPALGRLVRSLYNQYELWFDKTPFYKMFEDARGINWGRQMQRVVVQLPGVPSQQPTSPPDQSVTLIRTN